MDMIVLPTSSVNLLNWQYDGKMKRVAIVRTEFEKRPSTNHCEKEMQLQWVSSMYNITINNACFYNYDHTTAIEWQFPLLVETVHSKNQHMNAITTFCRSSLANRVQCPI